MQFESLRIQVLDAARECLNRGLIHGTSGNVSAADREAGIVAITPTDIPYDQLEPKDIPLLNLSDSRQIDGPYPPSKEAPMHTAILLKKTKMNAVVHTHSMFSTVMSILVDELPAVAAAGAPYSPTRVAPCELPGSQEIADAAVAAMGDDNVVCLLKNHGLIAAGPTLARAMSIAEYVEENAQTAYYCLVADGMKPIPEPLYRTMHDRAVKKMGLI